MHNNGLFPGPYFVVKNIPTNDTMDGNQNTKRNTSAFPEYFTTKLIIIESYVFDTVTHR